LEPTTTADGPTTTAAVGISYNNSYFTFETSLFSSIPVVLFLFAMEYLLFQSFAKHDLLSFNAVTKSKMQLSQ
jgi:hypothetical protein